MGRYGAQEKEEAPGRGTDLVLLLRPNLQGRSDADNPPESQALPMQCLQQEDEYGSRSAGALRPGAQDKCGQVGWVGSSSWGYLKAWCGKRTEKT